LEAQTAIENRDVFLSVAAHELKTPLTGLQGYTQLLMRQLTKTGTLDPQRVQQALNALNRQSDKLARLITQLLDITRFDAGKLKLELRPTNLKQLVEQVVVSAQTNAAKHKLVIEALPDIEVRLDPVRFEQVVANLLDNAIKYSPQGGLVKIDVNLLDNAMFCLSVTDQGIGIPLERRDQIFERFYQAHEQNYLSGMGLGLYITRQIVELHGGQIEVEFPPEGGTRFIVKLPRGLP
jgi:signal transduction histidine kinase